MAAAGGTARGPADAWAGMPAVEVARIARHLAELGATYQCNGGWAVDALLDRQARPHGDLDLFVDASVVPELIAWLEADGYRVVEDWLPVRVELRDGARAVDVHPMRIERGGDGTQALLDGGSLVHQAEARVVGRVDGEALVVADAATLLALRNGYELRDVDRHDVALLRGLLDGSGS